MDITFKEGEIRDGMLAEFYKIHSGAFNTFLVLVAYASEKSNVAEITIETIQKKTDFSLFKVVGALNKLKKAGFIEAPYEGMQGKRQLYKLKVLVDEASEIVETKKGFVYFVLDESSVAVKIGCTLRPEERFEELQKLNANELRFLLIISGTTKREKRLHAKFSKYRIHSEWFEYSDEIKNYVQEKERENMIELFEKVRN